MKKVLRFDLARFSPRTTRTPQGFLRAPAFFTRSGIFEYTRADGSVVRELRPEEEVFHKDSIATASSAPVTRDHPREGMVNPQNATSLSIGFAGETVGRKDNLLEGTITVMDGEAIKDVGSGKLREISMGYTCSIERTAGEHPKYGRYDQIQRNIRYNHIALGGQDWGRAGNSVGIRLDSLEPDSAVQKGDSFNDLGAFQLLINQKLDLLGMQREELAKAAGLELLAFEDLLQGWVTPKKSQLEKIASAISVDVETLIGLVPRVDSASASPRRKSTMEEEIVNIGGVDFTVPKAAAQAFKADLGRKDSALKELEGARDALQGRLDAQGEELKSTKAKVAELENPERFDSAVSARAAFIQKAQTVLGDVALVGSKRDIMEQVLKHDNKDLDLTARSDDYVEARFDALVERAPAERADSSKAETRTKAREALGGNEDRNDSTAARDRMVQANREAWKKGNADQYRK